jgi:hypothetical protein
MGTAAGAATGALDAAATAAAGAVAGATASDFTSYWVTLGAGLHPMKSSVAESRKRGRMWVGQGLIPMVAPASTKVKRKDTSRVSFTVS